MLRTAGLALLVFLCAGRPGASELDTQIQNYMQQFHVPGLSGCIVKNDVLLWHGEYGSADLAQKKPVAVGTLFLLASISKTVTGTALMQLWEEGRIGLDEDVNARLPFALRNPLFPDRPVTFRQLLTHTSGVQDNNALLDTLYVDNADSPIPLGDFLSGYFTAGGKYFNADDNFYPVGPGEQFNYTNVGSAVWGLGVESVSGTAFDQFCASRIFQPLHMDRTAWFLRDLNPADIAVPYEYSGEGYRAYSQYGFPDYPSGQIRTSAVALARFMSAHMRGGWFHGARILRPDTVRMMRTVQYPAVNPTQGIVFYSAQKGDFWGHSGAEKGCATNMIFSESLRTGVIVLLNSNADYNFEFEQAMLDYAKNISPVAGDIDGSGAADLADLVGSRLALEGVVPPGAAPCLNPAYVDYNFSGQLDADDLQYMADLLAGNAVNR